MAGWRGSLKTAKSQIQAGCLQPASICDLKHDKNPAKVIVICLKKPYSKKRCSKHLDY
nr:MAG TPA: hypothetical protein [Caudoviricetes sp.]